MYLSCSFYDSLQIYFRILGNKIIFVHSYKTISKPFVKPESSLMSVEGSGVLFGWASNLFQRVNALFNEN